MGLVERGNRIYNYRSVRRNGKVTSEYRGSGESAVLLNRLEVIDRDEADYQRYLKQQEREKSHELETELDSLTKKAKSLASDALNAAGYHNHKGEWRKRRGQ